jgi:hypothetical protein
MSSEYDTLYSLLENLIRNPTNEIVQPITISAIIPDIKDKEPSDILKPIVKRKPGRPPGSKNKVKTRCQACFKTFYMNKFDKHVKRTIVCRKFYELTDKPPIIKKPIHELIIDTLDTVTCIENRCRFCEIVIQDMKEHMAISYVCNRLAYAEFKKSI